MIEPDPNKPENAQSTKKQGGQELSLPAIANSGEAAGDVNHSY
jgi:hypothetical protein